MIKCMYTYTKFCLNTNVVLAQHTALPSNRDRKMAPLLGYGGISGALLTNLLKAFDCFLHDLLIAKLAVYVFH